MQFNDFTNDYATLAPNGGIDTFAGGDQFWSQSAEALDAIAQNWLISEYDFDADWPNWEMHPNGDEVVYLLSGDADLILEMDGVVQKFELRGRGTVIVPAGTWHTAKIISPARMLAITRGAGTESRPAT